MNAVPSPLLVDLSVMLERHHGEHLLASLSVLAAPHVGPAQPVTGPVAAEVGLVVGLYRLLAEHGQTHLLPPVLGVLTPYLIDIAPVEMRRPGGEALSSREIATLRGLAVGHSYVRIGRELGVSMSTAKTHARRLYAKLGAISAAHAVHLAHELGYLGDSPVKALAS